MKLQSISLLNARPRRVHSRKNQQNECSFDREWFHWQDNRHLYKYITPMHAHDRWRVRLGNAQEVGSYKTLVEAVAARDAAQSGEHINKQWEKSNVQNN